MPQEFYVLKCFSCETFQVHIVKKANKWECKMCGAKQSLKRNYGKGSSKDCRNQVMKLNELRISKCNESNHMESNIVDENWTTDLMEQPMKEESKKPKPSISKWAEFVENEPDTESETDDNTYNFSKEVVDKKKKRLKKIPEDCYSEKKRICRQSNESELLLKQHEEIEELCLAPNNENIFSFDENKQNINKKDFIQLKNEPKIGKYSKYLQDDDSNKNLIQKTNKTSNIFESSLTDLEDILNF